MRQGCGAGAAGAPQARRPTLHTHGVQLVQLVVGERGVSGAGAGICLQGTVPLQAPRTAGQPAAHPQALQQVADDVPEQATGQVQVGGGQWAAQRPQSQPQLLGGLGKVALGVRVCRVRKRVSGNLSTPAPPVQGSCHLGPPTAALVSPAPWESEG